MISRAGLGLSELPRQLNASDPGEAAVLRTLGPEVAYIHTYTYMYIFFNFCFKFNSYLFILFIFFISAAI